MNLCRLRNLIIWKILYLICLYYKNHLNQITISYYLITQKKKEEKCIIKENKKSAIYFYKKPKIKYTLIVDKTHLTCEKIVNKLKVLLK